ncbi:sodium/proline symporter [bacterium]|jgi:sodium/proline symporter|nr:sodium/proline symporter [bacterium]
MSYIFLAFGFYFFVLIGIALFFYKRVTCAQSYASGNKSLNYWVTAIAAQSSDMSSWLFMALPGIFYTTGLVQCWEVFGIIIFNYLNWKFVAPKLRTQTEKTNSITLSDFFEKKLGDNRGAIHLITALVAMVFFTCYISAGLFAMGRLFESLFGISYHIGMLIGITLTVSYILIGGFIAMAWSDFFQGVFLLFMLGIVPIIAFFNTGGCGAIESAAILRNVPLTLLPESTSLFDIFILVCGFGLGYFGQSHILINFMGIKNPKEMKFARRVGVTWQILALTASSATGIIAIAYFAKGISNPELIFSTMANQLFNPFIAGLVLCGVFAATITTIDTQILVVATTFTHDLYEQLFTTKKTSKRHLLWVSRIATIVFPMISFWVAYSNKATIYGVVKYAWSGLGSSFGPLVLTSLYCKKINLYGGVAGIIVGGVVSGLWPLLHSNMPSVIPGFMLSLSSILLVSGITKKP